jgi:hypothetical protein
MLVNNVKIKHFESWDITKCKQLQEKTLVQLNSQNDLEYLTLSIGLGKLGVS